MKKTFLKFLPLMAAVLLVTSCSKDEDNNDAVKPDTTKQANTETEQQGVPFTIKVVTGKKLSKIAYEDKGATVQPSFSESDVDNLVLDIYNLSTKESYGGLLLKDYTNGIFNGTLTTAPQNGEKVGAKIVKTGGFNSDYSTKSLTDLMEKCTHRFEGSFKYGSDNTVTLIDQNAYFEIFMSPLQHELSVKIDNYAPLYVLNDEGKIWIRVSAGIPFGTNFYSKTSPEAGTIYTIDRSGYVDLGLPNGTLWADKNVGATNIEDLGDKKDWNYAQTLTGTPTKEDIANITKYDFANNCFKYCQWEYTDDYNSQHGWIVYKVKPKGSSYNYNYDPHIFFPIEYDENALGDAGAMYWSSNYEGDNQDQFVVELSLNTGGSYYSSGDKQFDCYLREVYSN